MKSSIKGPIVRRRYAANTLSELTLQDAVNEMMLQRTELQQTIQARKDGEKRYEGRITSMTAELEKVERMAAEWSVKAEAFGERVETTRTSEAIKKNSDSLERQLKEAEKQ